MRTFLVATALAASAIVPGASVAQASHNCGLEEVNQTVDTICDHYHDKGVIGYILCIVLPTC